MIMDNATPKLSNTKRKKLASAGWIHQQTTTGGTHGTDALEIFSRRSAEGVQFLIFPAGLFLTPDGAIVKLE